MNGERASAADLNPGDEVRASLSGSGDEIRVEKLEVVSPGEQPGSPTEQQGSPHQR